MFLAFTSSEMVIRRKSSRRLRLNCLDYSFLDFLTQLSWRWAWRWPFLPIRDHLSHCNCQSLLPKVSRLTASWAGFFSTLGCIPFVHMTCLGPVDLIAHPFSAAVMASIPQILLLASELWLILTSETKWNSRQKRHWTSYPSQYLLLLSPLAEYLAQVFLRLTFCYHLSPFCCLSHPLLLQHQLSFGFPNSHLEDLGSICIFYTGSLRSASSFYIVLLCVWSHSNVMFVHISLVPHFLNFLWFGMITSVFWGDCS